MSRIFFEKNYILIKPSYKQTKEHKHNMLHLFVGKDTLTLSCEKGKVSGRVIALDKDIIHRAPEGELDYFLFIDPTTELATRIKTEFTKEIASMVQTKKFEQSFINEYMAWNLHDNDVRQRGVAEGIKIGMSKGIQQANFGTARNLLAMNMPIESIAKATGLSVAEIAALQDFCV